MPPAPTILFAGGGTGGHIFPSLAIVERLREQGVEADYRFLVSTRPLDAQILGKHGLPYTALPVQPLPGNLRALAALPSFVRGWFASVAQVRRIIRQETVAAVAAMGGYVSAPAVVAAYRSGIPTALINLDTPPGKANRMLAKRATAVFTVYPALNGQRVGLPLRRIALATADPASARREWGLDPRRSTLLVTGGSQGAESINQMMMQLLTMPGPQAALRQWQVIHLAGVHPTEPVRRAYKEAGVPAVVEPFSDRMGLAWSATTLAISRAGAGSVAEIWANATPTIFLPYPYHKDQHQKHNTRELVGIGGACVCDDLIDPAANAKQITGPLLDLMNDPARRHAMAKAMKDTPPQDGAATIAGWLTERVNPTKC